MEQSRSTEYLITRYEDAYGNWTYNTCTTKDSDEGQPWWATFSLPAFFKVWSIPGVLFFSQLFFKSFVLNRCATEVDQDGYVVDNAWGDCLDGCPGTRKHFREDLRPKLAYGWQGLGWDHWATWASIQFGQVHFGVFSTSRFTCPALSLVWILLIKCVYTLEWAKRGFMGFYVLGWVNFGRKYCFCWNIMNE